MNTTVALQKCAEYDSEKIYAALKEAMRLAPPPSVSGKTVLIKPNILYPKKPDASVCTNPTVVGALVKIFLELGAKKVLAGESPAVANSTGAAKASGIYDEVVQNGGEWADFHGKVIVDCPDGKFARKFEFADAFNEADIIVSAAKLKSHQFMRFTGAMKNLFGLVVGLEKAQCHYRYSNPKDFGGYLTDLNLAAKPQYAVMDSVVGMEGPGGPGSGDPIQLGFLAASQNILALDWICSSLVCYNPHNVFNLEDALRRKHWLNSEREIQIVGASVEECRNNKFRIVKQSAPTLDAMMPGFVSTLAKFIFIRTPVFHAKKCVRCGRCQKICPAHLITMNGKGGTAILTDKRACLHCFCCHEVCEAGAISLRRFIR